MLSLLRTNQFVGNILLLFYLVLVRFLYYVYPHFDAWDYSGGVAWNVIRDAGWADPGYTNMILAGIVTLIIAISLNVLEYSHRLTGELNLIPGAMFILLASIFPCFNALNPALIATVFMVYVINDLISLYKEPHPAKKHFNIGFTLSLACLFYPSAIWFFIFILVGLNIMRAIRIKEIFMILSGWLTLFFLVGVYYFWQDSLGYFWETQFGNSYSLMSWNLEHGYFAPWIPLLGLLLIFFWGLARYSGFQLKKSIQAKKSISLLFFYLVFGGLIFMLQPNAGFDHLALLLPGLAYVLALILIGTKPGIAEVIHFFLIMSILAYQLVV